MALPSFSNHQEENFLSSFQEQYINLIRNLCFTHGISFNRAKKIIKDLPSDYKFTKTKKHGSIDKGKINRRRKKRYHEDDIIDNAIFYGIKNFKRVSTTLLQRKTNLTYEMCKQAMQFVPKRYRAKA